MHEAGLFSSEETPVPAGVYARVVVERGIDSAPGRDDAGLTYRIDEPAPAGSRVIVPLGRSGKLVGGYVLECGGPELARGLEASRIQRVKSVHPVALSPALLELARWMASYYVCPLGMVLASMVPAAVKHGTGSREVVLVAPAEGVSAADDRIAGLTKAQKKAWEALSALQTGWPRPLAVLGEELALRSPAALRALVKAGLLTTTSQRRVRAAPLAGFEQRQGERPPLPTLNDEQQAAVEGIGKTLGTFAPHLLWGITGSGKTEVYLRLIERVLEGGGGAIVLVPEIALTPQTGRRFVERFGLERVAVLHSGLTKAQRHSEWERASSCAARVVVGARSAVFAPVRGLGLIVVDEEHDTSYKQDQLPRYHARDAAVKRAQLEQCPVVLGSATPSLESWVNATGASSRFAMWRLRKRAGAGRLPAVLVADMREERRARAQQDPASARRKHLLGPTLEGALDATLRKGGQAILLLNRRGFAHHLACPSASCGYVVMCEDCSACLVLHKDERAPAGSVVKCHHCRLEQRVPRVCPSCGKPLASLGAGTQKLEDEVEAKFAALGVRLGSTLLRLDSDSMTRASEYFAALDAFAKGEARVLVGTQMLAKGLDFPGVRLVGIVDADTALHVPDFRASERTFQLISQAAGRAGRGELAGGVIVQTDSPHEPAVVHASAHDFEAFAREEVLVRQRAGLPPSTRMARIVCRDEDARKAHAAAGVLAEALRSASGVGGELAVTGPAPCVLERVHKHYRVGVEVVAPGAGVLRAALTELRRAGLLKSDHATAVDVDPVALL